MTSAWVAEAARAKINLCLHITGRRPDGYHLLDSIVVFAGACDSLRLSPAPDAHLQLTGPFAGALAPEDDNLVLQAFVRMKALWPDRICGTGFSLEKNLPVASGIGGGSADAAAALRGLAKLWAIVGEDDPLPEELMQLALELGADVPVCLNGHACRMRGIGEQLDVMDGFPKIDCLLVNPNVPVATGRVFGAMNLAPGDTAFAPLTSPPPPASDKNAVLEWLSSTRNDMQPAACTLEPAIGDCLELLHQQPGIRLERMSGSGATCFGLFDSAEATDAAARAIKAKHPDWWVCPTYVDG